MVFNSNIFRLTAPAAIRNAPQPMFFCEGAPNIDLNDSNGGEGRAVNNAQNFYNEMDRYIAVVSKDKKPLKQLILSYGRTGKSGAFDLLDEGKIKFNDGASQAIRDVAIHGREKGLFDLFSKLVVDAVVSKDSKAYKKLCEEAVAGGVAIVTRAKKGGVYIFHSSKPEYKFVPDASQFFYLLKTYSVAYEKDSFIDSPVGLRGVSCAEGYTNPSLKKALEK